jgi:carbonic anhydrase
MGRQSDTRQKGAGGWLMLALGGLLAANIEAQTASPSWRAVANEQGRRIEVDTSSVRREKEGIFATSRLIMAREMRDTRSGETYHYIQTTSRYDCKTRATATLRRSFVKADDSTIRTDDMPNAAQLPVRSRTMDDAVLRELCRPMAATQPRLSNREQLERIRDAIKTRLEPALAAQAERGKPRNPTAAATGKIATVAVVRDTPAASATPRATTSTSRRTATVNTGKTNRSQSATLCAQGQRQAPIDVRDGIQVDLEPLLFDYQASTFSILDTGATIEVRSSAQNHLSLLGKTYSLEHLRFYRPSGMKLAGRSYAMSALLEHRAADGERLIVAVMLAHGTANPVVQTLWNHLPLERNLPVRPPTATIDLNQFLPEARGYHTFMGSLVEAPCSEGVLWIVLQTPATLSPEQEAIFAHLYPNNARPAQAAHGRLIKSSRGASGIRSQARQTDVPVEGGKADNNHDPHGD